MTDTTIDPTRIVVRCMARKVVKELREYIAAEMASSGDQCQDIYYDMLRSFLPPEPELISFCKPMIDAESRVFGSRGMPDKYRLHAGKRVDDVPLGYLHYVTEPDDFARDLRRYYLSKRVQQEQDSNES